MNSNVLLTTLVGIFLASRAQAMESNGRERVSTVALEVRGQKVLNRESSAKSIHAVQEAQRSVSRWGILRRVRAPLAATTFGLAAALCGLTAFFVDKDTAFDLHVAGASFGLVPLGYGVYKLKGKVVDITIELKRRALQFAVARQSMQDPEIIMVTNPMHATDAKPELVADQV
jgi:hypothetical protein